MNKEQFLSEIKKRLKYLPQSDIAPSLDYYEEMIDDYIENGMTPDEAVAKMGTVDDAVDHILSELSAEDLKDRRPLRAKEIVILAFAFPLILVLASVALALIISGWAVIVSLYAAVLSIAVSALAAIIAAVAFTVLGKISEAVLSVGAFLVLSGVAVLMLFAVNKLTVLFAKFNKFIFKKTCLLFTRRRKN